jgi:hypothetical protein
LDLLLVADLLAHSHSHSLSLSSLCIMNHAASSSIATVSLVGNQQSEVAVIDDMPTPVMPPNYHSPVQLARNRADSWVPNLVFLLLHVALCALNIPMLFVVDFSDVDVLHIVLAPVVPAIMFVTGVLVLAFRRSMAAALTHAIITGIFALLGTAYYGFLDVIILVLASIFHAQITVDEWPVILWMVASFLSTTNLWAWAVWNAVRARACAIVKTADQLPTNVVMVQMPPQTMPTTNTTAMQ